MARVYIQGTATNKDSDDRLIVIPNGNVNCYQAGSSTRILMYLTEAGVTGYAALETDAEGAFGFWIDISDLNKRIKVVITKDNYGSITIDDLQIWIPINDLSEKTALHNDDVFVIQDSEDSWDYKKVKKSNLGTGSGTKEAYEMAGNAAAGLGDFPVKSVADAASGYCSFHIPHDFLAITEFVLVIIPGSTDGTANLDIESDYGANGEAYNTHSESDTTTTYNITTSQIFEIDISGIFSSVSAGDYCGVKFTNNSGSTQRLLGIRLKYS